MLTLRNQMKQADQSHREKMASAIATAFCFKANQHLDRYSEKYRLALIDNKEYTFKVPLNQMEEGFKNTIKASLGIAPYKRVSHLNMQETLEAENIFQDWVTLRNDEGYHAKIVDSGRIFTTEPMPTKGVIALSVSVCLPIWSAITQAKPELIIPSSLCGIFLSAVHLSTKSVTVELSAMSDEEFAAYKKSKQQNELTHSQNDNVIRPDVFS